MIAKTSVKTLAIPAWGFRPLIEAQPRLALKMLEEMCRRLRSTNASLQG